MNDVLQVNPGNGNGSPDTRPATPGTRAPQPCSRGRHRGASAWPAPSSSGSSASRRRRPATEGAAGAGHGLSPGSSWRHALCAGSFIVGRATKPIPPPPAPPPPPPATAGVVALARSVTEGQALSLSDLTVITIVTGPGAPKGSPPPATKLPYFPASTEASLVGPPCPERSCPRGRFCCPPS